MAVPAPSARREAPMTEKSSVDDPLHGYPDEYIDCRGLSHAWKHMGFFREDASYTSRLAKCQACGCEKIQTMNRRTGALAGPARYSHPEGYLFKGQYVTKADVRRETMRRWDSSVYGSAEDLRKANHLSVVE